MTLALSRPAQAAAPPHTPAPVTAPVAQPDPTWKTEKFVTDQPPRGARPAAADGPDGELAREPSALSAAAALLAIPLAACSPGHVGTPGPDRVVMLSGLPGSGGPEPARPASAAEQPTVVDAARFLTQAGFGPRSAAEVTALRSEGYARWLWRQMQTPTLQHTSYLDWQRQRNEEAKADTNLCQEAVWQQWVAGEDVLRARMSFALSQILVISNSGGQLPPYALSSYWDTLQRHAFGNYRDLLEAVTLHPAMGRFLDMLGSEKANAKTGAHPNENYAREFLQLFTVGLVQLNPDGSPRSDAAGQPLPTYDETVVQGHARAFTGWTWAHASGFHNADRDDGANWRLPMVAWTEFHSTGEATTLVGGVSLTTSTPQADLKAAIDAAFQHPNVGPFIGRQLIQRLVTSNPSPAYVGRVAAVFADDGTGQRGNLKAVLGAILLDAEARDPARRADGRFGKLREPVLRLATLLRSLGASNPQGRNAIHRLDNGETSLGQSPLLAPSVFNFYSPAYRPPGAIAAAGLVAPEFQIATETTVPAGLNLLRRVLANGGIGASEGRLVLQPEPWLALAGQADGSALVSEIDLVYCAGQMSPALRQRLLTLIAAYPASKPRDSLLAALTLVQIAPDHLVQG